MDANLFIYLLFSLFLLLIWTFVPLMIGINKLRKSDHLKYKYLWLIIILFTSYLGLVFCILFIKKYDNLDKN